MHFFHVSEVLNKKGKIFIVFFHNQFLNFVHIAIIYFLNKEWKFLYVNHFSVFVWAFWLYPGFSNCFICCIKIVFIISYWFVVEEEEERIISIFKSDEKYFLKKVYKLTFNFEDFFLKYFSLKFLKSPISKLIFHLTKTKPIGDFIILTCSFIIRYCINNYFNYVFSKILSIMELSWQLFIL